jgi:hypothetical protein
MNKVFRKFRPPCCESLLKLPSAILVFCWQLGTQLPKTLTSLSAPFLLSHAVRYCSGRGTMTYIESVPNSAFFYRHVAFNNRKELFAQCEHALRELVALLGSITKLCFLYIY